MKTNKNNIAELKKQIKKANKEIKYLRGMIERDELTSLYNRRGFLAEISKYVEDVKKERTLNKKKIKRKFAINNIGILFIDINDFKIINDRYGHNVGDIVLKKIAKILLGAVRDFDVVSRWSGDEFVIGLVGNTMEDFEISKLRINRKLEEYKKRYKKSHIPTLSIGISALYDQDRKNNWILDINKVIDLADKMMYKEKKLLKKGR